MLPDRPGDAAGHGHDRVLRPADAALAPDLDLRLPHPRGRLDGRSRSSRSRSRTASPTSSRRSSAASTSTTSRRGCRFFFNAHIDFFEEIAKYRAARRIWARELRDTYGARDERSLLMRFHTQTAGVSLTAQQPLNNIVRTATEALVGGARRHAVAAHELLRRGARAADRGGGRGWRCARSRSSPTRPASRTRSTRSAAPTSSRRSPTGWRRRPTTYFRKIDELGGMVEAIKQNYPQREIADASLPAPGGDRARRAGDRRASTATSSRTSASSTILRDPGRARAQADRPRAGRAGEARRPSGRGRARRAARGRGGRPQPDGAAARLRPRALQRGRDRASRSSACSGPTPRRPSSSASSRGAAFQEATGLRADAKGSSLRAAGKEPVTPGFIRTVACSSHSRAEPDLRAGSIRRGRNRRCRRSSRDRQRHGRQRRDPDQRQLHGRDGFGRLPDLPVGRCVLLGDHRRRRPSPRTSTPSSSSSTRRGTGSTRTTMHQQGIRGSTLPAQHRFSPSAGGEYFLAISQYNRDPQSSQGEIFQDNFSRWLYPDGVVLANGFGGGETLSGWNGRAPGGRAPTGSR